VGVSKLTICGKDPMKLFVKSRATCLGLALRQPTTRQAPIVATAVRNPASIIAGLTLLAWMALATTVSASSGDRFNSAKLSQMDEEIQRAIAEHKLPGGVLWVECKSTNYHKAFGSRSLIPTREAMTEDTIFDVASLTKVLATVPALMVLYERGKVKLGEPVVTYLPEFRGGGKEAITVRHLLTHTSGFGRGLSQEPDWFDFKSAFNRICAQTLSEPPGTVFRYSDLNFIIVGEMVQRLAGMKLEEFCAQEIFKPLKMVDICFLPSQAVRSRIAPTEKVGREVLRGTVHDFKAQGMGGVAGHAGLFTTAADVARFARMILNQGKLDDTRILKADTVNLMTSVQSPAEVQARRGLGWDIDSDFSRPRGDLFPIGSFGHTGFTGVCLWIDPFSQTFWMFLSNRIHPDPSGNIYSLQKALATLAAEAVNGFDFREVPGALTPQKTNNERKY
jgi:CubicO group peptidase (beta-lactamase class C family)